LTIDEQLAAKQARADEIMAGGPNAVREMQEGAAFVRNLFRLAGITDEATMKDPRYKSVIRRSARARRNRDLSERLVQDIRFLSS
jgi:hypothetical protein